MFSDDMAWPGQDPLPESGSLVSSREPLSPHTEPMGAWFGYEVVTPWGRVKRRWWRLWYRARRLVARKDARR